MSNAGRDLPFSLGQSSKGVKISAKLHRAVTRCQINVIARKHLYLIPCAGQIDWNAMFELSTTFDGKHIYRTVAKSAARFERNRVRPNDYGWLIATGLERIFTRIRSVSFVRARLFTSLDSRRHSEYFNFQLPFVFLLYIRIVLRTRYYNHQRIKR